MQYNFSPEEALNKVFDQMVKQGLVPKEMENNKQEIIDKTLTHFKEGDSFSLDELKNNKILNSIMGLMVSKTLGLEPNAKEFLNILNKEKEDPTDEPNQDLEKKLKCGLKLIMLFDKLDKTPTPRPEGKKLFAEAEEELKEDPKNEDKKEKISEDVNQIEKEVTTCLRNLYGGDDPRISGEYPSVLLGPIASNVNGFVAQGVPDPNSTAVMIDQISYNPSKSDPLGLENDDKIIDEALGVMPDEVSADLHRPKLTHK